MSSKDEEVRSSGRRRRNILYLIERYLRDNCLNETSQCLKNEARLQDDYEICDNVDLDSIYLEYASFYQVKFGKYPKILKKISTQLKMQLNTIVKKAAPPLTSNTKRESSHTQVGSGSKEESSKQSASFEDSLQITQIPNSSQEIVINPADFGVRFDHHNLDDELVANGWKDLEQYAKIAIVNRDLGFRWTDVFGNRKAVETIKEAVIMPLKHPELFTDKLKPWKSLLLHGPPGGGKTLLARILCSETHGQITFFNITSSCITSKWRGESEKIIKVLFHYAKLRAPSVLFFDEVDALTSGRDRASDHEASKRFKNEFLQLLDGLEDYSSAIFVLASTNIPWDIDAAFLRRFEKKVLIGLPTADERSAMIERFLQNLKLFSTEVLNELTNYSEGFTGDQIRLACKEAAMNQIRNLTATGMKAKPITMNDLKLAFKSIKPIDEKLVQRHVAWNNANGT